MPRDGLPSFTDLAPMLDRLAELAERELHDPVKVEVTSWDDGDVTAVGLHIHGFYPGTDWKGREVLRYDPGTEQFEVRYIEEHAGTGEQRVLVERVIESYPSPL